MTRARWAGIAKGWETYADAFRSNTMPVSSWMVDAIGPQPGHTVLDLAAGIGDVGFLAAEMIEPGGTLITSDFVPEMLSAAQRRAETLGIRNVRFRQIDAQTMDLDAASLDGVLCRWGYMLMDDPAAALLQTRRVLRPGGHLALAAWTAAEDNPWSAVPVEVLIAGGRIDPEPPPGPGQFTWAPEGIIAEHLEAAGFVEYEVDALEFPIRYASVRDWWETTRRWARARARRPAPATPSCSSSWPRPPRRGRRPTARSRSPPRRGSPARRAKPSASMYYDNDADLDLLQGKTVAILGYGSQGHAHSLNLKDSGIDVVVGLRPDSASVEQARSNGLEVTDVPEAASRGDLVMVLLPDEKHGEVWREQIRDGIAPGNTLLFGHGFSVHYGEVEPPPEVDVALIAPKGPGHLVRRQFLEGSGVPALVAIHQNASGEALPLALAYAKGIGATRGGVIETTFKDETETDLFGEQAVLCGGVSELVQAGYETLVDAGYDPKLAYFECLHELKLIVDLMYEKGITGMRFSISNTAEYGDLTRGKRIISETTRQAMKDVLGEIQSGEFAREWIAENRAGQENFKRMREEQAGHQIEREGKELRSMMDWIETEF